MNSGQSVFRLMAYRSQQGRFHLTLCTCPYSPFSAVERMNLPLQSAQRCLSLCPRLFEHQLKQVLTKLH